MGRVVAWAVVLLAGSSCSPAGGGVAPGPRGDDASEARADGEVASETSTDTATSDEPGDVSAVPPIDQDAVADDGMVHSDVPMNDVITPNDAAPAR